MKLIIKPSDKKGKKKMAVFKENNKIVKVVYFGAEGYDDYTIHKDLERQKRYKLRHQKNENWEDMYSPGSLSWYILWHSPSYRENVKYFKNKFNLE